MAPVRAQVAAAFQAQMAGRGAPGMLAPRPMAPPPLMPGMPPPGSRPPMGMPPPGFPGALVLGYSCQIFSFFRRCCDLHTCCDTHLLPGVMFARPVLSSACALGQAPPTLCVASRERDPCGEDSMLLHAGMPPPGMPPAFARPPPGAYGAPPQMQQGPPPAMQPPPQ